MAHMTKRLPKAIDAELRHVDTPTGRQAYYVAGTGSPLLLIHSINAAGSAYEVKPIFEHYRQSRRVYAVDLPGFGHAERSNRRYDIALYTDAVDAMARLIADETNCAPDALALSLSSEFLGRAAGRAPDLFQRLVFVTPTGFRAGDANRRGEPMSSREIGWLSGFLSLAGVGSGAFRLLTRPGTIRYFLKRTWGSPDIDDGLAEYDVSTTRQPGAQYAPIAFISGALFSRDVRTIYESLAMPVLLAHGTKGDFQDFRGAAWTEQKENWAQHAFDTGALPHFEKPAEFFAVVDSFFSR